MWAETMMVTGLIVAFLAGFITAIALIVVSVAQSKRNSDKK